MESRSEKCTFSLFNKYSEINGHGNLNGAAVFKNVISYPPSVLIFPPNTSIWNVMPIGQYLWIGAPFENTIHVLMSFP